MFTKLFSKLISSIEMTNLPLFATTTLFHTYSQASFFIYISIAVYIYIYICTFMYTLLVYVYAIAFQKLMLAKDNLNITSKHLFISKYKSIVCFLLLLDCFNPHIFF